MSGPFRRTPAHVGIVTCDLDAAMGELGALLGLTWNEPRTPQISLTAGGPVDWTVRRVNSVSGPIEIEVLQGSPGSVWSTRRVSELHHYAYASDDLDADSAALLADGWSLEVTLSGELPVNGFGYFTKPGQPRVELMGRRVRTVAVAQPAGG